MITTTDTAMMIHFVNPVHPVDPFVHRVFVEILNLVLLADNAAELHKRLLLQDFTFKTCRLSGYFKWSFDDYSFILWQRIKYGSGECFKDKILEVKHISFIVEDRRRPDAVKN